MKPWDFFETTPLQNHSITTSSTSKRTFGLEATPKSYWKNNLLFSLNESRLYNKTIKCETKLFLLSQLTTRRCLTSKTSWGPNDFYSKPAIASSNILKDLFHTTIPRALILDVSGLSTLYLLIFQFIFGEKWREIPYMHSWCFVFKFYGLKNAHNLLHYVCCNARRALP